MTSRRALVVHTRMPAFDRDRGSEVVDQMVQFLLRAGWQVSYLSREDETAAEVRHAQRLRRLGVATYSGFTHAERVLRSNDFDLALVAFWELAAELQPLFRSLSPATRVVVNSIDVHFLRGARRMLSHGGTLAPGFGTDAVRELNAYNAADAVLAVSDKERELLGDFLGDGRVHTLPLADATERSDRPLEKRAGMYFVGNFRHLPNVEAVEHLCNDVLPLLDPELLQQHPLRIVGSWLERANPRIDASAPGVEVVGWVPTLEPYIECSRITVVPLLHGAGVKGKVIQAMRAGTPVVTTPVGAEGLDLVQGEHALIGEDAGDLAAGITRLLTNDRLWHDMADAGAAHARERHDLELVERRFNEIIDAIVPRDSALTRTTRASAVEVAAEVAVAARLRAIGQPDSVVLLVATDPDIAVDLGTRPCWPFPQDRDGAWGYPPADGASAVRHLEAQRASGARWFVLPRHAFGWLHRYPELFEHLDRVHRRVHQDEHLVVWDLGSTAERARLSPPPAAKVRIEGRYAAHRTGPPPDLVAELGRSDRLTIVQRWLPDTAEVDWTDVGGADFVVSVRDDALLPGRFLDSLVALHAALDVDRLQPTHTEGPAGGPPVTERQSGAIAREVDDVTPLPVLSVRVGASPVGSCVLTDDLAVGLRRPLTEPAHGDGCVRRAWVRGPDGAPVEWRRGEPTEAPRISVVIATYGRTELLRACLRSFAVQTLPSDDFEVVVVDDGTPGDATAAILRDAAGELPLTTLRTEHSGRSAAKNHGVLLARAPIVLFFDDDDVAAPDLLERHLAAHAAHPEEGAAILGHTDWAPDLELTPLMHYVTDVDRLLFAYARLADGQQLDWRGFWEGRVSCKRSLLVRHGLHDQRLPYSIDIEMAWRLAPAGLRVFYDASARSLMARPIDFEAFCERTEAKGRSHALIAALHPDTDLAARLEVDRAASRWAAEGGNEAALRSRIASLEGKVATDPACLGALHTAYREAFRLAHAKGAAGGLTPAPVAGPAPSAVVLKGSLEVGPDGTPEDRRGEPLLSITIPVWSRTPELAEMASLTIDRIWEVARLPTEVVVIDNGSPFDVPLAARVHRFEQNRGVSIGWNAGIAQCRAPIVVVLNSDCRVEPGWDSALFEAATDGHRIAFPYTDHCDAKGFTEPDQAGTAGWCFALSRSLYDELGTFDEWFSPAYCEDTDYWHRAWAAGVDLSPVPAARVVHARRTSSDAGHEALLQAHRAKYGWKHGVDPLRAPPYYHRAYEPYLGTFGLPQEDAPAADRPRVFCLGLNKTGTSSFHEAMQLLGLQSLHWGGPAIRQLVEASSERGEPLLSRLDPRFDAFSDIRALSSSFSRLDAQYPGSRFVLTVRPVDAWVASRHRHVEVNQRRRDEGTYHGTFVDADEDAWRAEWETHLRDVRLHFRGRDDLLELDLTLDAGWAPLCEFLGVPIPAAPFPWANRTADEGVRG